MCNIIRPPTTPPFPSHIIKADKNCKLIFIRVFNTRQAFGHWGDTQRRVTTPPHLKEPIEVLWACPTRRRADPVWD